ncbi:MAG: DUF4175 family protein, partial [Lentisphaeraceae bacterium]|nr:DUF4175 family protein [Lentisphaeraceae bacterium]
MIELVDGVRAGVGVRRFLFVFFSGILTSALLVLLSSFFIDNIFPREDQQYKFYIFVGLIPLFFFFKALRDISTRGLSRQDIALKVEDKLPELMDSYACALEIAEKGGPQTSIEEALTRSVENRFESGEITQLVTPGHLSNTRFWPFLILSCLLFAGAMGQVFRSNAMNYVQGHSNPELAGLEVSPGDVRLGKGEDLSVEVLIKRGELQATLEYRLGGEWHKQEMYQEGDKFFAKVYGVDSDGEYRIVTPSLKSDTFKISVFLKPRIEKVEISIIPPQYTNKKPFVIKEIKDIALPAGSEVKFSIIANKEVKVYLQEDKGRSAFNDSLKKIQQYSMTVDESHQFSLVLQDSDKNEAKSKVFKLNVVKDMPPHIEVIKPGKDVKKTRFEVVDMEINVIDDYAVTAVDLHLEYSFGSHETYKVFRPQGNERVREKNSSYPLDLKELGLKEGDVLAYYISAEDNHQPLVQKSRSKVYFIEIRPDETKLQDKEDSEKDGGPPQEQLSVKTLISAQKDLIRKIIEARLNTTKNSGGKYKLTPAKKQELAAETAALKLQIQKKYDEAKEMAKKQNASLGLIGDLFESSIEQLKLAEKQLNKSLLDTAMRNNSKSLSELVKIAIELEKNSRKSKSKSKPASEQQEQEEEEQEEKDERLADMLEKLEELEEQQQQLNEELKAKSKEELQEEDKKALAEKMKEQQKRLEKMAKKMKDQKSQQQASQQMDQASQQMDKASQQM